VPDESWTAIELYLKGLPGCTAFCERVRKGLSPWPEIGVALTYCTEFPSAAFHTLLWSGDFDVRWPLSFTAAYLGASGGSVDRQCAEFLAAAGLSQHALAALPEYIGDKWMNKWRMDLERKIRTECPTDDCGGEGNA